MSFEGQSSLQPILRPEIHPAIDRSTPIQYGRVIGVNPNHRAIHVALLAGGTLQDVPLVTPDGFSGMGTVGEIPHNYGDGTATPLGDDSYAVIAYVGGEGTKPICIGFVPTEINSLSNLPARHFERIPGGRHLVVEPNGSQETWFSDGSWFRAAVGDVTAHYSMGGADFDQRFSDMGGTPPLCFTLQHVSGNQYTIWKDGSLELTLPSAPEHAGNAVKIVAGGATIIVNVDGTITLQGTVKISGSLAVSGKITTGGQEVETK